MRHSRATLISSSITCVRKLSMHSANFLACFYPAVLPSTDIRWFKSLRTLVMRLLSATWRRFHGLLVPDQVVQTQSTVLVTFHCAFHYSWPKSHLAYHLGELSAFLLLSHIKGIDIVMGKTMEWWSIASGVWRCLCCFIYLKLMITVVSFCENIHKLAVTYCLIPQSSWVL